MTDTMAIKSDELLEEAHSLIDEAKVIVIDPEASAEDREKAGKMTTDAKDLIQRSKTLKELEAATADLAAEGAKQHSKPKKNGKFNTWGEHLLAIWKKSYEGVHDPRLVVSTLTEPAFDGTKQGNAWVETKDLVENVGAAGGFLVFPEHRADLFMLTEFQRYVRQRALVLPMRARQILFPTLDQTGTTAGQSNLYGGVVPQWTEEVQEKDETDPVFRQAELTAHELVCYTEVSDNLLADSAIGLEALLTRIFGGAIGNEEEWTFIAGTGAGQPLGVSIAPATFVQPRAAAGAISIVDVFNMLSHFLGQSPIWLAHQSSMPQILQLNGPAGNPQYVWIGNGRDQMPATLMGFPIFFVENAQTLGVQGDLILADFSKYVIGDRQQTTIDSSKHARFRHNLTVWRAVHRVDGRPWLSAPLTLRDGATQVSPFVVLGDPTGS